MFSSQCQFKHVKASGWLSLSLLFLLQSRNSPWQRWCCQSGLYVPTLSLRSGLQRKEQTDRQLNYKQINITFLFWSWYKQSFNKVKHNQYMYSWIITVRSLLFSCVFSLTISPKTYWLYNDATETLMFKRRNGKIMLVIWVNWPFKYW